MTPPTVRNPARERLARGELSLGVGIRVVGTVDIAKAMKTAGFDWLFIDLEHGALSIETASQLAIAALDVGIAPIVRVPNGEFSLATRLLDNGALGIVVPHVDTAEEARVIADKLRYPPKGHRGVFSSMPHFDFRAGKVADMTAALNATNLIAVMLETETAIANAEAPTISPSRWAFRASSATRASPMPTSARPRHAASTANGPAWGASTTRP